MVSHINKKKGKNMSHQNILHYCTQCEKDTVHFNAPSLFSDTVFECLDCENNILLEEGEEVVFIHYKDEDND